MSVEQYSFAGYGYKITDSEDIDYYWEFFDDEEREAILCGENTFYHRLGDYNVVFIGFKIDNNLSKDKFIEKLEEYDKKFWASYIQTLGEARKPLGEPKVMFFTYWN